MCLLDIRLVDIKDYYDVQLVDFSIKPTLPERNCLFSRV